MQQNYQQRLFWSVSRPMKHLGLTIDEWVVTLFGMVPGIVLLTSSYIRAGLFFVCMGITLCWMFKKYKRLSKSFKIKSFLIAKGGMPVPVSYPKLLKKPKVGK